MNDLFLYAPEMYVAENELAFLIARLATTQVDKIEPQTSGLLHKQPDAVVNACTQSISILTGPAGTGKTTTLRKIIDSFQFAGLRGAIACPTGKAGKRADEVVNFGKSFINRVQCGTTHATLEYDAKTSGFRFNRKNHMKLDYIVMDEFPMQELLTMRDFAEAIVPGKTRVVLSGDQYQLPSVGPGNIARDIIRSGIVPCTELDTVLRTGKNSGITYNANKILRGTEIEKNDPVSGEPFSDFFFVGKGEEAAQQAIIKWISEDIPTKRNLSPIKDVQLMCPGKNSLLGTKLMNAKLRDILNPKKEKQDVFCGFRVGDKVINNKNDKKTNIVNGDVGFVKEIVRGDSGSHAVIDFGGFCGPESNGFVNFNAEKCEALKLAYALTVHKMQGSESPIAIMPIFAAHTILLTRNLLYTGLTRAQQLGILVGDINVLKRAIKNTSPERRQTRLTDCLKREFQKLK